MLYTSIESITFSAVTQMCLGFYSDVDAARSRNRAYISVKPLAAMLQHINVLQAAPFYFCLKTLTCILIHPLNNMKTNCVYKCTTYDANHYNKDLNKETISLLNPINR